MPYVVGLTGGIGSGKSTVAKLFSDLGITTISADQLARDVVLPGSTALNQITDHFGSEVINPQGELDRTTLRDRIFQDDSQRQWLETLLHPLIAQERSRIIAVSKDTYVVVEIPLLVEKGLSDEVDRILVVEIPEPLQIARVTERDGGSADSVEAIMGTQASSDQRRAQADDLIDNSGTLAELRIQVEKLHEKYLQLFASQDD